MTFYQEMQEVASSVLKEFNQGTIAYVQIIPANGPADDPGQPTIVKTIIDAVAKGVSYKYVKDGLALSSDLIVTMAVHSGITPAATDYIEVDGVKYKIVENISVPAAGTRAVWKFIVRKG